MVFWGLKTRTNHPMLSEAVQMRKITSQGVQNAVLENLFGFRSGL